MPNNNDALNALSTALVARTRAARPLIAEIHAGEGRVRTGTLWRHDVVVASEQSLLKSDAFEIVHAGGTARAKLAGRDPGTNVAVLKLDAPATAALPAAADALAGGLALAFGADGHGGATVHVGTVSLAAPAWTSRAGGRIDARIHLDLSLPYTEEGGPVVDPDGHLLGISTLGPRGRVLAIPASTVARVIDPLLANGHIARGWLGLALQPVAVPEALRAAASQDSGLMALNVVSHGPAANAGVVAGDILLSIGGVSVTRMRALVEQLGPDSIGHRRELRLVRAGALTTLSATITPRPTDGC